MKYADDPDVDSLSVWEGIMQKDEPEEAKKEASPEMDILKERDATARKLYPRGSILLVNLDDEHWLAYGAGAAVPAFFNSNYAYLTKSNVQVAGRLAPAASMRLSGLLWPEARKRWSETAYLTREGSGRGQVILFASMPNFRGYFHGAERLLLNALFLGPGFGTSRPIDW
jgi:hypothetical protein